MLLIGAVVLAGGGIGYYFKIYKPKHEAPDLEDDYCEYEDGELEEIAEEPEDEIPRRGRKIRRNENEFYKQPF